jgi:MoaA/NifB/PqqE/SkfB family radical SAM enzyme
MATALRVRRYPRLPKISPPAITPRRMVERSDIRLLRFAVRHRLPRTLLLWTLEGMLRRYLMDDPGNPLMARRERAYMGHAVTKSLRRFLEGAQTRPVIREALLERVLPALVQAAAWQPQAQAAFRERYGEDPPAFITVSPTRRCNLHCTGCYAGAGEASGQTLPFDVFNRILEEKKRLWGSWFTVISGGEPFLYRSQGKSIFDVFERHPDNFFLVYTNGTLLQEQQARRLAELGNVTPAISVEGYEEQTDSRRGKGVYARILKAFEALSAHGVPYGVSITAFRHNAQLFSERLFARYLHDLGALYIWIFQYMPIGRGQTLDMLVTPEQRLRMYRETWRAVRKRGMFIADFWNSGSVSNGCISGGRPGGYLYIQWDGHVTPCVFNPYSPVNIHDIYREGRTLDDVLRHPFMKAIRNWQADYALDRPPAETGNFMTPCPMKDHYDAMLPLLQKHRPRPIDEGGEEALGDASYQEGLKEHGRELARLLDPIWEREVLAGERRGP